ncbi:DUF1206 domain-containing protein [Microcella daejeonensis]|uniref:DUF1206 domain-containing protein n=1 Tax=Microcella daejeonensis TaxID=2994971 RepID=UPI00226D68AC|nr:DUF1206 domain-containing protein [Microcella daejeonensis]WAB83451.1 DUF1206 domain-containing protein [Microcella daejeonensis]
MAAPEHPLRPAARAAQALGPDTPLDPAIETSAGTARAAHSSRVFTILARSGWAVTGLLHLLIGGLAIALAVGNRDVRADEVGAFDALASPPLGGVLLAAVTISLAGLGVWMIADALLNQGPMRRPTSAVSSAAQGLMYLGIATLPLILLLGGELQSGGMARRLSADLLGTATGTVVLVLVGAGIAVAGGYFVVKGLLRRFSWELRPLPPRRGRAVRIAGLIGYVARGIAFLLLAGLIIVETLQADADGLTGLDGAFSAVREVFLGPIILGIIGAGLIVYGLYGFARARLSRI